MNKISILGAGVTLALMTSTAAMAQALAQPQSQAGPAPFSEEELDRIEREKAYAYARQNNTRPVVMTPNSRDEFNAPKLMYSHQADKILGGPEGVRRAMQDDNDSCLLGQGLEKQELEVQAADLEVQRLDKLAANEQNVAIRRQLEAQASRARNNFRQILLTGLRTGAVAFIPGVGWAYGLYVLGSEWSNWLNRQQHNVEMTANDARVAANDARIVAFSARLGAMDKRLRLADSFNRVVRGALKRTCDAMDAWDQRFGARVYQANPPSSYSSSSQTYQPYKPQDW